VSENDISHIFSSLINEIRKLEKSRKLSIEEDELLNNSARGFFASECLKMAFRCFV